MSGPRVIVANLDCEQELAAAAGVPVRALSAAARRRAAALGTLLRAFALAGDDILWTLAPVDPAAVCRLPWLPVPRRVDGALERLPRGCAILAWGVTPATAALRPASADARLPPSPRPGLPVSDAAWRQPAILPEAAAHANDREVALAIAAALDCALPGASVVHSIAELEHHLAGGGARAAPEGCWVAKAPLATAGRLRVRGRGDRLDDPRERGALEDLLARFGRLVFEPWMERSADFGCLAWIGEAGVTVLGVHRQSVSAGGRFTGLSFAPAAPFADLAPPERERVETTMVAVGERLRALGYRGPVAVDSWRYRDAAGAPRFHALGEINARLSFGFVARALAERLAAHEPERTAPRRVDLWLGDGRDPEPRDDEAYRIVAPLRDSPVSAWLSVRR